jgi:hypothetical protein
MNAAEMPPELMNAVQAERPPRPYFKPVEQKDLHSVWPFVRPALETVPRADGWLVEDIYMMLRSNGATLYMIYDETGEKAGFFVLRLLPEFDGPRVHIFILYAKDTDFDPMALFMGDLDRMAMQAGATRITFSTNRPGWHKVAPDYGFSPREITYERLVNLNG